MNRSLRALAVAAAALTISGGTLSAGPRDAQLTGQPSGNGDVLLSNSASYACHWVFIYGRWYCIPY